MNVVSEISGVSLPEMARTYGTPFYLYDSAVISDRVDQIQKRFPLVRYAQKANPHLAILDLMRKKGVLVDSVSAGEVHRALRAGYPAEEIVYTADVFDDRAVEMIKNHPIQVNCGSPDMIRQFAEIRPGGEVFLRINPGFGHGHSKKTDTGGPGSKHGIWHEEIPECVRLAKECGIRIYGLHMHIGSGSNFEHLSKVAHAMAETDAGPDIRVISAGGGLPIPYRETDQPIDLDKYFEVWDSQRKEIERRLGHEVEMEIEPGRFLVAESGYLVAKIWAIKETAAFKFYLVDTGFNHLIRPAMYGAYHKISMCSADGRKLEKSQPAAVAGPLCESCDVFTQEDGGVVITQELPQAQIGDYVIIHDAGAYGRAMASNYNTHPFPAEVWIEDGKHSLITPRQSFDEAIGGERFPG
ncbi:MAG: diaminopimelate decarboxylase [Candidatus Omnitrophica bacterium]|nr:diaminopimelate decarboxylase [Candidatus Omnitrophota bacterium]